MDNLTVPSTHVSVSLEEVRRNGKYIFGGMPAVDVLPDTVEELMAFKKTALEAVRMHDSGWQEGVYSIVLEGPADSLRLMPNSNVLEIPYGRYWDERM